MYKECARCSQNPKAKNPKMEMKELSIESEVYDKIVSSGQNPSCLLCDVIHAATKIF